MSRLLPLIEELNQVTKIGVQVERFTKKNKDNGEPDETTAYGPTQIRFCGGARAQVEPCKARGLDDELTVAISTVLHPYRRLLWATIKELLNTRPLENDVVKEIEDILKIIDEMNRDAFRLTDGVFEADPGWCCKVLTLPNGEENRELVDQITQGLRKAVAPLREGREQDLVRRIEEIVDRQLRG